MSNHSFLFITTQRGEDFTKTRINHSYESMVLPPEFIFEIENKSNGKNILNNKLFTSKDIKIRNSNRKDIPFKFISINNQRLLNISALGWNEGSNDYEIQIGSELFVNFTVNIEKERENGKESFTNIGFDVYNYEYQKSETDGLIHIKI